MTPKSTVPLLLAMSLWPSTGCGLRDISPYCELWDKRHTNLTWKKPKLWSGAMMAVSPDLATEKTSLGKAGREGVKCVRHECLAGGQRTAGYRDDGEASSSVSPMAIHFNWEFRDYFSLPFN